MNDQVENDVNGFYARTLSRKEREKRLRKQEILTAARQVFAIRGFGNATLDEIAERAEFGKGTLYNYFQNKDELFDEVVIDGVQKLVEVGRFSAAMNGASVRDVFMDYAKRLLTYLYNDPAMFIVFMREHHKPTPHAELSSRYPELLAGLAAHIAASQGRGEILSSPPEKLTAIFIGNVFTCFKMALFSKMSIAQNLVGDIELPTFTQQEIADHLAEALQLLDATFFYGIYRRESPSEGSSSVETA